MSVLHVSQADLSGGAGRAAYRLHRALLDHGASSRMEVRSKTSDDWTVEGPAGKLGKFSSLLRYPIGARVMRFQKGTGSDLRTGNWVPSAWSGQMNVSPAKVVNLHWVGGETLSVGDIGRIRKPVVWTLHDMWAFCGTEHYAADEETARWRQGYTQANRPAADGGLDLDRRVWALKRRAWQRPMHLVAPSQWLADCARKSVLFRDWPISVIPNVLDTRVYQPLDRVFCRQALGLPDNRKIVLFGAIDAGTDPRKGFDLLIEALWWMAADASNAQDLMCVVFGQSTPEHPPQLPFSTRWMGHIHDDRALALLYNAADVIAVPSRQEAFGQTGSEAQACGRPVVAFGCTGLQDVVAHGETGYLARTFDAEDLANGLGLILNDAGRRHAQGQNARARALRLWAPEVIVPQYLQVYDAASQGA